MSTGYKWVGGIIALGAAALCLSLLAPQVQIPVLSVAACNMTGGAWVDLGYAEGCYR